MGDWNPVALPYIIGLYSGGVKTITIDPTDPTTAYIVGSSAYGTRVLVAKNYGASWQDISYGLPKLGMTINSVAVKPGTGGSSTVFLGTNIGVWSLVENQAGKQTWEPFGQGFPDVVVTDLRYYAKQNLLVAATYGRGVFEVVP